MSGENKFNLLIYKSAMEDASVEVVLKDETIWATQKAMAALFDVKVPAISKHITNIVNDGELSLDTTLSRMETVVRRGFRGSIPDVIEYYNLHVSKFSSDGDINDYYNRYDYDEYLMKKQMKRY